MVKVFGDMRVRFMTLDRPYSILITDDDPVARETLREIVAPQGYHTLMAESGRRRWTWSATTRFTWPCSTCTSLASRGWRRWPWCGR